MDKYTRLFAKHIHSYAAVLFTLALVQLLSCDQNTLFNDAPPPLIQTPREAYISALDSSGLGQTQLVKAWKSAGVKALEDSILQEAPFQEIGYFRAEAPEALAYRIDLRMGEALQVSLTTEPDSVLFFVDLFRVLPTDSTTNFNHLFNAENHQTDSLRYEIPLDGTYLLRIQPELLVSCRFTLQLIVQPVYGSFPVSGKQNRDIWSLFGDPRDGGKRIHKGIDIFARRGTPVVATTEGVIRSVRERGLGGKQIWLYDRRRGQSMYYAHLDSQLVREGQWVQVGDTLGLVGNTGNARNTRPHLHFGIYRRGYGAVDPYPFVAYRPDEVPSIRADTSRLGQLARVRLRGVRLQSAPQSRRSTTLATLNRHLPLEVIGASKAWYRVRSPDGKSGYLPVNNLEDIDRPLSKFKMEKASELLRRPLPQATPVSAVQAEEELDVIGKNGSFVMVRNSNGNTGWIQSLAR